MLITDVRAHHIRIPYDAGPASFRQGASAIAALDMVLVEVSTDAGLTGWGDAFAYVCPRTTRTADRRDDRAAGARPRSPRCGRDPRLHGADPAQSASVRPLRHHDVCDLRRSISRCGISRAQGEGRAAASTDRRNASAKQIPAYASLLRIGAPDLISRRMRDGAAARLWRDQAARDHDASGVCRARGDRRRHPADGRHELPAGRRRARSPSRMPAAPRRRCSWRSRSGRRRILRRSPKCAPKAGSISRRARMPARCINSAR